MALTAHLVDLMLPIVPIRQWVLSLAFALRYSLAYDSGLVRDVLYIFIRTVFSSLRRRARQYSAIRKAKCGAVTFVQCFGGAINLKMLITAFVQLVFGLFGSSREMIASKPMTTTARIPQNTTPPLPGAWLSAHEDFFS
jgi:hypothetical protein